MYIYYDIYWLYCMNVLYRYIISIHILQMQPLTYVKMVRCPRQQSGPFLFGLQAKCSDSWNLVESYRNMLRETLSRGTPKNHQKTPRWRKENADLTVEEQLKSQPLGKITAVSQMRKRKNGWQKGLQ